MLKVYNFRIKSGIGKWYNINFKGRKKGSRTESLEIGIITFQLQDINTLVKY